MKCENGPDYAEKTIVQAVESDAEIRQIKTMADRSITITINLPEYSIPQAQQLMDWMGDLVRVAFVKVD